MTEKAKIALELMRLEGICKMLSDILPKEELESKYLQVSKQDKVENLTTAVRRLSKSQLREIIEKSIEITEDVIIQYFEDYRYGRKPGFVLYWAQGLIGKTISSAIIQKQISARLEEFSYNEDDKHKDLKCTAVVEWKENETTVFEIGMSYLTKYNLYNIHATTVLVK